MNLGTHKKGKRAKPYESVEKGYKCIECGFIFRGTRERQDHNRTVHGRTKGGKFREPNPLKNSRRGGYRKWQEENHPEQGGYDVNNPADLATFFCKRVTISPEEIEKSIRLAQERRKFDRALEPFPFVSRERN